MELQHTCLQAKVLLPELKIHEVLGRAMDPPTAENISIAVNRLEAVGAISTRPRVQRSDAAGSEGQAWGDEHGAQSDQVESVTKLGLRLASMPLEPMVGRMLLWGVLFKCFDPILTAAVCAGSRNPFVMSPLLRDKSQQSQRMFHHASDLEAKIQAFTHWSNLKREHGFSYASNWAYDNMLLLPALLGIEAEKKSLVNQLHRSRVLPRQAVYGEYGEEGVNLRAYDEELRAALVLSGRATNLAAKKATHGTGFHTASEGSVQIHPGSVNVQVARGKVIGRYNDRLPVQWLNYGELVQSGDSTYIRDTTFTSDVAAMVFGGLHTTADRGGGMLGKIDDWILCRGDPLDYQLLMALRSEMDAVLLRWIRLRRHEFTEEDHHHQESVIQTVVDALHYHGRHHSVRSQHDGRD